MKVKCVMDGCDSTIEAVASARYICSKHERRDVLRKLGREYVEGIDDADEKVRFQTYAHDKTLDQVADGSKGTA